jgi:hypothetical protein
MATKWADYCISKVQYNGARTHINKVKIHPDNGDSLGAESEWARTDVVDNIQNGKTFVTVVKNGSNWNKGEDVRVVTVNGAKYIRTDANLNASDNLGSLPEF